MLATTPFHHPHMLDGNSLFVFGPGNPIRMSLALVITTAVFEWVMIALIVGSSALLTVDTVFVDPSYGLGFNLFIADCIFTGLFCIEAVMKIIVAGFLFNGPGSYLRSSWNALDLFIVLVSIAVIAVENTVGIGSQMFWLRGLRGLRGLRLLRAAAKIQRIRIVVSTFIKVLGAVGEVLLVGILFYFIFAVMTVSLLGGKLFYCTDFATRDTPSPLDPYYLLGTGNINEDWCRASNRTINTSVYHSSLNISVPDWQLNTTWTADLTRFDNVIQAIWTLFQMATLESWSDMMYSYADATEIGEQPLTNANRAIDFFFIVFIVIGAFLLLNLIIGLAIDKYHDIAKSNGGMSPLLTEEQQQWLTIQKLMTATTLKTKYMPPTNVIRRFSFNCVFHPFFEVFIMACILGNVLCMFMTHWDEGDGWDFALSLANAVFTGIFVVEMFLKWLAIGVRAYFKDAWNIFDFIVVIVSVAGVLVDYSTEANLTILPLLRVFRVARVFRLIAKAKGLRIMLQTFVWSLPAVTNVGAVMFVFQFVYAIVGMNLFGAIKHQENIDYHANFESFGNAMITLFRMVTGENWSSLMWDCMVMQDCIQVTKSLNVTMPSGEVVVLLNEQYLDPVDNAALIDVIPDDALRYRCSPAPILAVLYFDSYIILVTFLLLQLIIGIILDNIQSTTYLEEMVLRQEHLTAYVAAWESLDPYATSYIPVTSLTTLLLHIPPPLGVKGLSRPGIRIQETVMSVDIPNRNNRVHFLETLHALAGRVAGAEVPPEEEYTIHDKMIQRLPKEEPMPKYTAGHFYAAMQVCGAVRGFLHRRRLQPAWTKLHEETAAAARASLEQDKAAQQAATAQQQRPSPIRGVLAFSKRIRESLTNSVRRRQSDTGTPASPDRSSGNGQSPSTASPSARPTMGGLINALAMRISRNGRQSASGNERGSVPPTDGGREVRKVVSLLTARNNASGMIGVGALSGAEHRNIRTTVSAGTNGQADRGTAGLHPVAAAAAAAVAAVDGDRGGPGPAGSPAKGPAAGIPSSRSRSTLDALEAGSLPAAASSGPANKGVPRLVEALRQSKGLHGDPSAPSLPLSGSVSSGGESSSPTGAGPTGSMLPKLSSRPSGGSLPSLPGMPALPAAGGSISGSGLYTPLPALPGLSASSSRNVSTNGTTGSTGGTAGGTGSTGVTPPEARRPTKLSPLSTRPSATGAADSPTAAQAAQRFLAGSTEVLLSGLPSRPSLTPSEGGGSLSAPVSAAAAAAGSSGSQQPAPAASPDDLVRSQSSLMHSPTTRDT